MANDHLHPTFQAALAAFSIRPRARIYQAQLEEQLTELLNDAALHCTTDDLIEKLQAQIDRLIAEAGQ